MGDVLKAPRKPSRGRVNRTPLLQRVRRVVRPAGLGVLRRTEPLSPCRGFDRGTPVDRYYIGRFLAGNSEDIRGRVLEAKDRAYTERFGSGVIGSDVLDTEAANPLATIVADLTMPGPLPPERFDCFVLTQTLQSLYEMRVAVENAFGCLRPGGVLLATMPMTSRIAPRYGLETDYWRFTPASCRRLFGEVFGADHVAVQAHGNVLSSVAFLAGMAREELNPGELDAHDDYFPLVIAIRT